MHHKMAKLLLQCISRHRILGLAPLVRIPVTPVSAFSESSAFSAFSAFSVFSVFSESPASRSSWGNGSADDRRNDGNSYNNYSVKMSRAVGGLGGTGSGHGGRDGRGGWGGRAQGQGRGGGRGEYFKNKYGGGRGRGRGRGTNMEDQDVNSFSSRPTHGGGSYDELQHLLRSIDGKSYGAYHELDTPPNRGWVNGDVGYTLYIERAQSDPFAPPTRCRVVLESSVAAFPLFLYSNPVRRVATADFVLRSFYNQCKQLGGDSALEGKGWGGPKGGDIQILEPGQHVLEQSAIRVDDKGNIVAQLTINLPAKGRSILGQAAEEILGGILPAMVQQGLSYKAMDANRIRAHVESVEDQYWLQSQLNLRNLVAFVPNGAILPRKSGVDDQPMDSSKAVPFVSPKRLEISFELPNAGIAIAGMGIPKGITLICGGGYHGKSTLLGALQVGVYPKIPGDGREFCLTSINALKIRAEDGRNVQSVDISTFINNLPFGQDTTCFCTLDASGSTSQAANIVEAIEAGADALLIDEDTCATNFMIRDDKMMQLVAPDKEPITPFIRIVRSLFDDKGISTVMVVGGVGDYFDVADNVVTLDCYHCLDVTERAKQIVANSKETSSYPHSASAGVVFRSTNPRTLVGKTFSADGKVKVTSKFTISYGETQLDIGGLEQVVAKSQTVAIANALQRIPRICNQGQSLRDTLSVLDREINTGGLNALTPGHYDGGMSRPRSLEIAGAINRLRTKEKSILGPIIV